ncbi:hypothetical protein [Luteolibacter marinus]|uniref:hypothetical protein n=1 Tax=Luteolibacter marinus TaxID=2776705 RepID=UPI001868F6F5|nr:hypothetical protein [Luteolibacter marinus]
MARWSSQTTHQDISGFSDNPHLRKELKVWRMKVAAVVLVVLAVIGLSAKPAYRAFREYRINKNMEAAMVAARLEDWGSARDKARSVLMARRNDFEAFRLWTRALGKMGEPRAYLAAAQLFTDPRATRDDRLECLRVLAVQAPQAVGLSAYASLDEALRDEAEFRAAITPLLVKRGEFALAEKGLRESSGEAAPPEVKLELLRTLCAVGDRKRMDEARRIFADMVSGGDEAVALEALLILGETPGGLAPGEPLPEDLPQWVAGTTKATTLHHLLALHPRIEANPGDREQIFREAIDRFLAVDPGPLGTWLVRHNRSAQAVELLEEPAKSSSSAYLAWLNALLRLDRHDELEVALDSPPASTDMVEVELVRAAIARYHGNRAAATAAWTRALNQAAFDGSRNRFIEIAGIAQGYDAKGAVEDAWVGAVCSGWGPLPLYTDLLHVFGRLAVKGRSEDLLAMYRVMLRFEPQNPELINNFNYLALIHGILPPEQVADAMEALVAQHPEMPELDSALMLARMMDGDVEGALGLVPKVRASERVAPMMKEALEGSALVLAGKTAEGRALLSQVNWRIFMRQERIAFRDLLIKLQIAGLPLPELERIESDTDVDQVPAWRKAVEKLERDRSNDVLPALPAPRLPGQYELPGS